MLKREFYGEGDQFFTYFLAGEFVTLSQFGVEIFFSFFPGICICIWINH